MSEWGLVTLCVAVIFTAPGYSFQSSRGYQNEQFSQNQQFSGSNNVQWSRTSVTPDLYGLVQQGLGMVNYDASNIQIQQMRQRMMSNGLQYKISFQNPAIQQNCVFQLSYCTVCSVRITPIIPSCSSPCPGNACIVDTKLRNMDSMFKVYNKHWIDRQYDERDYEGRTQSQSMDDFRSGTSGGMGGMGMNGMGMGGMGMGGMGMGGGGMGYMNGFRSIKKGYYQ